jgi:hypothetical protein
VAQRSVSNRQPNPTKPAVRTCVGCALALISARQTSPPKKQR